MSFHQVEFDQFQRCFRYKLNLHCTIRRVFDMFRTLISIQHDIVLNHARRVRSTKAGASPASLPREAAPSLSARMYTPNTGAEPTSVPPARETSGVRVVQEQG